MRRYSWHDFCAIKVLHFATVILIQFDTIDCIDRNQYIEWKENGTYVVNPVRAYRRLWNVSPAQGMGMKESAMEGFDNIATFDWYDHLLEASTFMYWVDDWTCVSCDYSSFDSH